MKVIYEDNSILVVDKAAGIPSQSAKITERDMVSEVNNYLNKGAGNKSCPVFLVHRLDRNVAGLLVFAKTKESAANLNKQIQDGKIQKYYYALVSGKPNDSSGRLENYLLKDSKTNKALITDKDNKEAKKAILEYKEADENARAFFQEDCFENVFKNGDYSILNIKLLTGRFHQIRAQLSNIGCPIVGDIKYGGIEVNNKDKIGLVAYSLEFIHPVTKKPLKF